MDEDDKTTTSQSDKPPAHQGWQRRRAALEWAGRCDHDWQERYDDPETGLSADVCPKCDSTKTRIVTDGILQMEAITVLIYDQRPIDAPERAP